jgi:hypothetical protein
MTSYRPVFTLPGGEKGGNGQRFATHEEAHASALARFMVWTTPTGFGVEESTDPVNYRFVDGHDEYIEPKEGEIR